jgi:threonine/homoserine/homoserine lactone efflux protein
VDALLEGLVAGYGIAVPVGAVAVVIVGAAARHGRRAGMAAGAGAATADFAYAAVAAVAGTAAASVVAPVERPARMVAAAVLVALAVAGVVRLLRPRATAEPVAPPPAGRLYAGVLGLTLANPVTLVYFASLMVGLPDGVLDGAGDRIAFAAAAGVASLSWQWLLAAAGGLLHGRLTPAIERATTLVGSATVATLGLRMALR